MWFNILGILLIATLNARMIYLIRHAEKPRQKSNYLSALGYQRSQHSINFMVDAIITQSYINGKSKRPYLTVLPLAERLHLTIDNECESRDIDCVVNKIGDIEGDVLVSWEHKRLGKILKRLGFNRKYPKHRFDLVWTVDTSANTFVESEQTWQP